ncbi:hypothetical protein M6D81_30310 [Paenibacillus sp. J5C_2022]|uniref:nucleotidyltransferase domain-containing protein n=1 Tax=Paenibacillus sp. J5C2022 TaxID=2977129 RepID=UPI0021CE32FD|nr:hypothetical protein [Paenibacillus sp. J5C2022]MCU6713003.1 hypothetical protein [Paenibacillus sp. J5C2022]
MYKEEICHSVHSLMKGFQYPWAIAGGWAIDLHLGSVTREHSDIEIMIYREDQFHLQHYLTDWHLNKVVEGAVIQWDIEETLELPIHEVHAEDSSMKLEVLLNESNADKWVYRRNNQITCPKAYTILHTSDGLPYLCPEIVLLYKSKNPRPKDEQDFVQIRDQLSAAQRSWLREAIEIMDRNHPWIDLLD